MVGDQTILLINTAWDSLFTFQVSRLPRRASCFKLFL
jgi:hypothetical protein